LPHSKSIVMFRSVCCLSVLFFAGNSSLAQTAIPARHLEKITYDTKNNDLLVFGGAEYNSGKVTFPSNVSIWNGSTWKIIEAQGPGTRAGHSLIYHEGEKVTYVLSGLRNEAGKEHVMLDVWKWDGSNWTQAANDAPMKTSDGVYDSHDKRLLMFGDVHDKTKAWDGGDPQKFELWEFKGGKWKLLSSDGPQPEGNYEVAYDKQRRALVIPVWESGKSFIWEWKNEKWNKIEAKGGFPEARNRFALAYDGATNAVYMFGGRSDQTEFFSDFWKWDGSHWEKLLDTDVPGRAAATMEAGFGGLILYGGVTAKGPCNEIWIWKNNKWNKH
jgi:hypothetical protein